MIDELINDGVTVVFLTVLCAAFVLFLIPLSTRASRPSTRSRSLVQLAPSVLATTGVLGTFAGIFLGLLEFDVRAIDESVPQLLAGLKTAFVTSLAGLFLSIVYRVLSSFVPARRSENNDDIRSILSSLLEEQRRSNALSHRIASVISDEDRPSLSTTITRANREQIDEFRKFADHMVANTHSALIEALEDVIRNFNEKLSSQFGENFRELNVAVGALVLWQENYRAHIELLEERLEHAVGSLNDGATALQSIHASASAIPDVVAPLATTLTSISDAIERVNRDLEAYAAMHDKAREALPLVNANLDAMTTRLATTVDSLTDRHETILKRHQAEHERIDGAYESLRSRLEESVETTNLRLTDSMVDVDRKMKEQLRDLEKQLGEQLSTSLQIMDSQLASLSGKFVEDYGPLTDRLREVVRIAEGIAIDGRR